LTDEAEKLTIKFRFSLRRNAPDSFGGKGNMVGVIYRAAHLVKTRAEIAERSGREWKFYGYACAQAALLLKTRAQSGARENV